MEKKGARPHTGRPARRGPEGRGRRSPLAQLLLGELSCPSPPLLLPAWTSAVPAPAPEAAATALALPPLFGLPLFPRIRIWVDSAPGAWQGAGPLLASLLSLSIHCALGPRRRARCHVPRGVCAADGPPARSLLDFAVPGCRALCSWPALSPTSHLSWPPPSLTPQPPGLRAPPTLGISCPCSFGRGGPGSVTCAALYGAVCKNKPVGILVVSVPSRSRRPGRPSARAAQEEGVRREGWELQAVCSPPGPSR